jgi:hypothetical protein
MLREKGSLTTSIKEDLAKRLEQLAREEETASLICPSELPAAKLS